MNRKDERVIELSICSFNGVLIRDAVLEDMHRLAKQQLREQGVKIKTSRHPGGRGAGGGVLVFRLLFTIFRMIKYVSWQRNNKEFETTRPSFEIYLRDSELVEPGSVEGWCSLVMERPKELLYVGYMISEILKAQYPFYKFHVMAGFSVPDFNYNLEFMLQGELTKNRIGMALRFMPTELKSYINETVYMGDSPLITRSLVYFDSENEIRSSSKCWYFKFDKVYALSKRKNNIMYVKDDSSWTLYPRYFDAQKKETEV